MREWGLRKSVGGKRVVGLWFLTKMGFRREGIVLFYEYLYLYDECLGLHV